MKNLVLAAMILTVAVSAAQADLTAPTYILSLTTSASNWYVWCQQAPVSMANDGLSSFLIDIYGTGGTQILTSSNRAPVGDVAVVDPDTGDITHNANGMWYQKGAGTVSGGNVYGICAGQGTVYTGANDPFKDSLVVRGLGQSPGIIPGGAAYACPLMLARGTFSGPGTFSVNWQGNALNSGWVGPGNVWPILFIPEPATMSLLGLAGLALLRRRAAK